MNWNALWLVFWLVLGGLIFGWAWNAPAQMFNDWGEPVGPNTYGDTTTLFGLPNGPMPYTQTDMWGNTKQGTFIAPGLLGVNPCGNR